MEVELFHFLQQHVGPREDPARLPRDTRQVPVFPSERLHLGEAPGPVAVWGRAPGHALMGQLKHVVRVVVGGPVFVDVSSDVDRPGTLVPTGGRADREPPAAREVLLRWTRRPKTAQALAQRARMVLASAEGHSNTVIARQLRVSLPTVGKWRERFRQRGLEGLTDEPRPGAPRTVSDEEVERVLTRTLETIPEDATHWSTRAMAQRTGLSQSMVSRIWRAFALQPHRSETFKLSKDPLFTRRSATSSGST